ncbi:regulatory protein, luxR family [Ruminococcus sp. YE71]|uniref:helix-turn-helix domain-containing protein n=1 Tax=unclassified Ruminococcus TaxID=2608920 RepID=UPI00088DBB19|nr:MULTISPECIES: helix-turn-helix transcriptional regulator [unclassified Ruminococcus]SDA25989.1 regulatory protein, luxR family [Ruminococcus sp. YE78]SFW35752.1 regulatory protein, luxR family [Ruminococcus sp. YE71]
MLSEREWITINNILLELYSIDDIHILFQRIMNVLHSLIHYSKGYITLLDDNEHIREDMSFFVGMDEKIIRKYISYYFDDDYLRYLFEISIETTIFQDTKIVSEEMRRETSFYKNFLEVIGGQFGCGLLIIHNGKLIGILSLFKSINMGDFTEKDIYILDILKFHIENMLKKHLSSNDGINTNDKFFEDAAEKFELTLRETEVLKLLCSGFSNSGISDMLAVSLSTVKTHIYNIYTKTGVNSRAQLINMIFNEK